MARTLRLAFRWLPIALALAAATARADTPARGQAVSEWRDRTPAASTAPAAGEDCATVYYPPHHSIVLYGGKGDDDRDRNELWEYDLDHDRWTPLPATGGPPPALEDHVLVYDPIGDRVLVHGGENGLTSQAFWAYSFATHAWSDLSDATTPRREDHTAVYDARGKRLVLFGGWAGQDVNFYDVRAYGLDPARAGYGRWTNLTAEAKHPWGRSDHAAVYDSVRNRMVIYGGWDKDQKEYLDDTWAYTFAAAPESAGTWKEIKAKRSHPPRRRHAVGVYDPGRNWFVIFGGYGDSGYLNDVWALDLAEDVWIDVTPGPQPRIDHQAVFDPVSGHAILYGGDARLGKKLHDVWELQIRPDAPIGPMIEDAAAKKKVAATPVPPTGGR